MPVAGRRRGTILGTAGTIPGITIHGGIGTIRSTIPLGMAGAIRTIIPHGIRPVTTVTIALGMVDIRLIVIQHRQDVVQPTTADVPSDVAITAGLRRSTITTTARLVCPPVPPPVRRLPLAAVAVAQAVAPLAAVAAVDARLLADAHLADEGK